MYFTQTERMNGSLVPRSDKKYNGITKTLLRYIQIKTATRGARIYDREYNFLYSMNQYWNSFQIQIRAQLI